MRCLALLLLLLTPASAGPRPSAADRQAAARQRQVIRAQVAQQQHAYQQLRAEIARLRTAIIKKQAGRKK